MAVHILEPGQTIQEGDDGELQIVDLLRILYRYKIKIGAVTLALGILVAGWTLTLKNSYASSAALIIQEQEIKLTGEAAPLTIEMLSALCKSTEVQSKVYSSLKNAGKLEDVEFKSFQRSLQVGLERKVTRDPALLPLIKLTAKSNDPNLAAEVANAWSDVALDCTRELYSSGIDDLTDFTKSIYDKAKENLAGSESALTSETLQAQLVQRIAQVEEDRYALTALYTRHLELGNDLAQKEKLLGQKRDARSKLEIKGVWLGEHFNQVYRGEEELPEKGDDTPILNLVCDILAKEQALSEFEEHSELQFMEMDLSNNERQLERVSEGLLLAQNGLAKSQTQYETLKAELAKLSPTIELKKAISDDALWQGIMQGAASEEGALPGPLVTQEPNQVYLELQQQVLTLAGDIAGEKSRIEYYDKEKDRLKREVNTLASEISTRKATKQALEEGIAKDREIYDFYKSEYTTLRQDIETLRREFSEDTAQKEAVESEIKRVREEINTVQKQIMKSQDRISSLQRDVDNALQVRESLAARAEEVMLLKISARQQSRSGTTLLYKAEANPLKTGPARSKIVLAAMALALVLSSTLAVMRELVFGGGADQAA